MIWKIAKKEFLLNQMTFKFAVVTIVETGTIVGIFNSRDCRSIKL
ncbi:MAG: hypothetical protein ACETWQ_14290 [Phycisphaerae bacterium]